MITEIYKAAITALFPLIYATYIRRRRQIGKEPDKQRFNERLGKYIKERPQGKLYWFHGASVGESVSALPLINKLLDEDENLHILVTTGTLTSAEIMAKRLPKRAFHQFIAFDVPLFCRRLLKHFKPDGVLWFESELWPGMLSEIKKAKIPLILINGRVSDRSFKSWRKFRRPVYEMLSCFTLVLGQSEQDKERLEALGARNVRQLGNLKFSGQELPFSQSELKALKEHIGARPVFFISSTHENEEEQLLSHYQKLKDADENIFIIIAPRHPNRGTDIKTLCNTLKLKSAQRSKGEPIKQDTAVYIADTIGEMGLWYKLAQLSFIGGSLIKHGGQNFIEPARAKNAVIIGPYTYNFNEMISHARQACAITEAKDAITAIKTAATFLKDKQLLESAAERAFAWAKAEDKVLDDVAAAVKEVLAK